MKRLVHRLLIVAAAAFVPHTVHAQNKHGGGAHTPKHGGVVVEVKDVDFELVAKPGLVLLYVSDHGKPMKLTSAGGKVTVFNGNDKVEAPLVLVGDLVEAHGNFKVGPGTKVLVEVALNGKPAVAARFALK